jgi:hypothetical protein
MQVKTAQECKYILVTEGKRIPTELYKQEGELRK